MITARLAQHIATARERELPADVLEKVTLHVLDTVAAMVSGVHLPAGEKILPFVASMTPSGSASVIGGGSASPTFAALANGMLAHADETDDSHAPSLTHPGCAVVPAALAVGEHIDASGRDLLRAVTAGYDVGPRISSALGGDRFFDRHHGSHAFGGLFGAVAAGSALACANAAQSAAALAYAVQMASGNSCWRRDPDHVEKAFDFGGMPAQAGTLAGLMAADGFTGSHEPIEGTPGLFAAFPEEADPSRATDGLGERYCVMETAIKRWCVGSPIQAALDSLESLMAEFGFGAADVERVQVDLPRQSAPVVDDRDMPAVNLQHQLALMLLDGTVTFVSGHDLQRMGDPTVVALRARIGITPRYEQEYIDFPRQAVVTATLCDGRVLSRRTQHVRGTPRNPMTTAEVVGKSRGLMIPVVGEHRANSIVAAVMGLHGATSARGLGQLLRQTSNGSDRA